MVMKIKINKKTYVQIYSEFLPGEPGVKIRFFRREKECNKYFVLCKSPASPIPYLSRYTDPIELAEHLFDSGVRCRDISSKATRLRRRLRILENKWRRSSRSVLQAPLPSASSTLAISNGTEKSSPQTPKGLPQGIPAYVLRTQLGEVMNLSAVRKHPAVRAATCENLTARLRASSTRQFGLVVDMKQLWPRLSKRSRAKILKALASLTPLTEQTAEFRTSTSHAAGSLPASTAA